MSTRVTQVGSTARTPGLHSLEEKQSLLQRVSLDLQLVRSESGSAYFLSMNGMTSVEVTRDMSNLTPAT